jgi:hypothetical protein
MTTVEITLPDELAQKAASAGPRRSKMGSSRRSARSARAELIVTGDRRHLLPIGIHQGIAIVTAREVLNRLGVAT